MGGLRSLVRRHASTALRPARRTVGWLTALVLLAPPGLAQGGYTTEEHPELGMEFARAKNYQAVPVQPEEEWIVLYFAEKVPTRERDRKRFQPELSFVWIDRPAVVPTSGVMPAPLSADAAKEDAVQPPAPIVDFATWRAEFMSEWEIDTEEIRKARDENAIVEYEFVPKDKGSPFLRWACTFEDSKRTVALVGLALEEDFEDQVKIWRYMAGKLEFSEPRTADRKQLELYYAKREFTNVEYRMKVRSGLVRGWEADDTENFIFVYSTKDEPLIRAMKSELEAIRKEYVKLFPAVREVSAVSAVRICKDRAEYMKYGGPPGSGGYWNEASEELVFYDYENVDGKSGTGKADTRVVLYHEAFHQYIHYAVGELPPHSWFNEGTGDYFSGAVIKGGKVLNIGVNPWRIEYVQAAIERRHGLRWIPFSEILRFEQSQFYVDKHVGTCYAQAWSMVYFLRTSKEARKRSDWAGILDHYFETLKREWAAELAALAETGTELTDEAKDEAGKRARNKAVDAAFADIDLRELERAWMDYTLELKVPK